MTRTTSPLLRAASILVLVAVTAAMLVHTRATAADADTTLAEAQEQVRVAQLVVDETKATTRDARARRDRIRDRVTRQTTARDASADRADGTQLAFTSAQTQVGNVRTRLVLAQATVVTRQRTWQQAHRKWLNASEKQKPARAKARSRARSALNEAVAERRAARERLTRKKQRRAAASAEAAAARNDYLAAQAAVDRSTNALIAAQTGLTEARAVLDAARAVLAEAEEHYAELLALTLQEVTVAVANIPNRVAADAFTRSMDTLAADGPDFIALNEISKRTEEALRAAAPGYGAYRGGARLTELGAGNQSINNAVMWRTDSYQVVDKGRIRVVNDDHGYHQKKPFIWDRYATWVTLRRISDNQSISVISTHMPTNPAKFPKQHGNPALTRIQLYARGMDRLVALAEELGQQGRVLVGGDMNSHPNQGYWSAVAKMSGAGYGYTKDSGVMYLFHPLELSVQSSRQLRISSDHPALVTTVHPG